MVFFQGPLDLYGHGPWSVCKATHVHMDLLMVTHEEKMEHVNAKTTIVKFVLFICALNSHLVLAHSNMHS